MFENMDKILQINEKINFISALNHYENYFTRDSFVKRDLNYSL
jgi:hypothetical protein